MQLVNSFFADNRLLTLAAAIAAFLLFAVLVLLFVRLLFGNRLRMSGARGRQQRLGVVDAYDMDRQRQLVLVRRDNTEHLIMIGGPNDLLIESAIVRVEGRERPNHARETAAEAPRIPAPEALLAPAAVPVTTLPPAPVAPSIPAPPPLPAPPSLREPSRPLAAAPDEAKSDIPSADMALEPAPVTPLPPPSKESPAPRADIFSRMRRAATRAPSAPDETPVPSPVEAVAPAPSATSTPPAAPSAAPSVSSSSGEMPDADFFETEIAKALAPSMRVRPTPDGVAGPGGQTATAPGVPTAAPRAPFRPFPPRRDASDGGTAGAPPSRPLARPPPPPFFSRMTQKPRERIEPTVSPDSVAADREANPDSLAPAEPSSAPEAKPVEAQKPDAEMRPDAHNTPVASHEEKPGEAPASPAPVSDPFEEEMARLLGRAPSKGS